MFQIPVPNFPDPLNNSQEETQKTKKEAQGLLLARYGVGKLLGHGTFAASPRPFYIYVVIQNIMRSRFHLILAHMGGGKDHWVTHLP